MILASRPQRAFLKNFVVEQNNRGRVCVLEVNSTFQKHIDYIMKP